MVDWVKPQLEEKCLGRADGWVFVRLFVYSFEYAYGRVNTWNYPKTFPILEAS